MLLLQCKWAGMGQPLFEKISYLWHKITNVDSGSWAWKDW